VSPMRYTIGLDFGPSGEPTGLAIVERALSVRGLPPPTVNVRHVERFPPGIPLPEILRAVARRTAVVPQAPLIVDRTAVGASLISQLRRQLKGRAVHIATITAGGTVEHLAGYWRIPKTELVTSTQWLLQTHRLKIAQGIPHAELLLTEMADFRLRRIALNPTDHIAWREGAHDDLVFAVALACWFAERNTGPSFVPRGIDDGGRTFMPSGVYL
jgi:hypothetical protein